MTPDDSVAPVIPSTSDNPRRGLGGVVSFVNWFKEISDWITGLSPAGADRYDTGVLTSGVTMGLTSNVTDLTYKVRRRGKTIMLRVDFTYIGPTQTGGSSGNVLDQKLFTLPPGWRPWDVTYDVYLGKPGWYEVGATVDAGGSVWLGTAPPGVTITTGDPLRFNATLELP